MILPTEKDVKVHIGDPYTKVVPFARSFSKRLVRRTFFDIVVHVQLPPYRYAMEPDEPFASVTEGTHREIATTIDHLSAFQVGDVPREAFAVKFTVWDKSVPDEEPDWWEVEL